MSEQNLTLTELGALTVRSSASLSIYQTGRRRIPKILLLVFEQKGFITPDEIRQLTIK